MTVTKKVSLQVRHVSFHFSPWQLRVIRAFRSVLEDLGERRSMNSYHSFHSLRGSRCLNVPQTSGEDLSIDEKSQFLQTTSPSDQFLSLKLGHHGTAPRSYSARYHSGSSSYAYSGLPLRSRSYENVLQISKHHVSLDASLNSVSKVSTHMQPKIINQSETQNTETALWLCAYSSIFFF